MSVETESVKVTKIFKKKEELELAIKQVKSDSDKVSEFLSFRAKQRVLQKAKIEAILSKMDENDVGFEKLLKKFSFDINKCYELFSSELLDTEELFKEKVNQVEKLETESKNVTNIINQTIVNHDKEKEKENHKFSLVYESSQKTVLDELEFIKELVQKKNCDGSEMLMEKSRAKTEEIQNLIGEKLRLSDENTSLMIERDKWKAKAEELERKQTVEGKGQRKLEAKDKLVFYSENSVTRIDSSLEKKGSTTTSFEETTINSDS